MPVRPRSKVPCCLRGVWIQDDALQSTEPSGGMGIARVPTVEPSLETYQTAAVRDGRKGVWMDGQ